MKNNKAVAQKGKAKQAQKEVRVAPAKKTEADSKDARDTKDTKAVMSDLIRKLNELVGLPVPEAEQQGEGEQQAEGEPGPKQWEMNLTGLTIGVDLGDKKSNYCILTPNGKVLGEDQVATEREAIRELFEQFPASRVVIEIGTHSGWIEEVLEECGH